MCGIKRVKATLSPPPPPPPPLLFFVALARRPSLSSPRSIKKLFGLTFVSSVMNDRSARDRHGHRRIGKRNRDLSLPSLSNRHVFPIKPESFTSYVREKRRRNSRVARPKIFFFWTSVKEFDCYGTRPPISLRDSFDHSPSLTSHSSCVFVGKYRSILLPTKYTFELSATNRSSRYLDSFPINKFRFPPVIAVSTIQSIRTFALFLRFVSKLDNASLPETK